MLITLKYEHGCPRNRERYSSRIRKKGGHPDSRLSSWLSQSSVLAKRLWTTRTTHFPPARASTVHSVAIGGPSGPRSELSATYLRGGSHAVILASESIPGPKCAVVFPAASSTSVGTNHDDTPGPVAIAAQTSSGVPVTSTSTAIDLRPDSCFFTLRS